MQNDYLQRFSKALKLSYNQELLLACSLSKSHLKSAKAEGIKFLKMKVVDAPNHMKETIPQKLVEELLVSVLTQPDFDSKVKETLLKSVGKIHSDAPISPLVQQLLNDSVPPETKVIMDIHDDENASDQILSSMVNQLRSLENGSVDGEEEIDQNEIQKYTNDFFSSIYHGTLSLEEFIERLKRYRSSESKRERLIFECTIHNIVNEFVFYLDTFPESAVKISAILFGHIINNKLTTSEEYFNIKLRCVLKSLTLPKNSKRFLFGMISLQHFKDRLKEWKSYCLELAQIQNIALHDPALYKHILSICQDQAPPPQQKDGLNNSQNINKQQPQRQPPKGLEQPDPEEEAAHPSNTIFEPSDAIKDEIHFIVNNVSLSNLEAKCVDLKQLLTTDLYEYFAHYLVVRRVSSEENFHQLYLALLDTLDIPELKELVLKMTYLSIKSLLGSKRICTDRSDRLILKNFGSWLGRMTLARNKAIFHKDLSLKQVVIDAYKQGTLFATVPFVSKVLMACKDSKIYVLPNPWLISNLALLVEITLIKDIILNLKFEVELLLKHLEIDIAEIKPSNHLAGIKPYNGPNRNDFVKTEYDMKSCVFNAMTKTVEDLMDVVANVVNIASSAIAELVQKDFSTEPDINNLLNAASFMVQTIAIPLGQVHINKHTGPTFLNNLIEAFAPHQHNLSMASIERIAVEKVEKVAEALMKFVVDNTMATVNTMLKQAHLLREKFIEKKAKGQTFVDQRYISTEHFNNIPDYLRPRIGGLAEKQLNVYGLKSEIHPTIALFNEWEVISRKKDLKLHVNFVNNLVQVLSQEYYRGTPFNQKPFFTLFVNCLELFNEPSMEWSPTLVFKVMHDLFAKAFIVLQPKKFPLFAFPWLDLISHRKFVPHLLNDLEGRDTLCSLFVALFEFMEPFLKKGKLTQPIRALYGGTLRILTLILHDTPEFLAEYYFSFCDVIPSTCVQMRNIILSAFPKTMMLPDPHSSTLKIDALPESQRKPIIKSNYIAAINNGLLHDLHSALENASAFTHFLRGLIQKLRLYDPQEIELKGTNYNLKVLNSFVLYLGEETLSKRINSKQTREILCFLSYNLDNEGRYYFFSSIANQLRYPNSHTVFFSSALLYLFGEARIEIIQEQIARVLVERVQPHRPIPWGLLVTYIELIRSPAHDFWNRGFCKNVEIKNHLLEVANRCLMSGKQQSQ